MALDRVRNPVFGFDFGRHIAPFSPDQQINFLSVELTKMVTVDGHLCVPYMLVDFGNDGAFKFEAWGLAPAVEQGPLDARTEEVYFRCLGPGVCFDFETTVVTG